MQENNFLGNSQIVNIFKYVFRLVKENLKFIAGVTLAFFIASIIYSFTLSPKYQIVADIKLKDESASSSIPGAGGSVLNLITGGAGSNSYWDFYNIVFSSEVAEELWSNGYDEIIFSSYWDEGTKKYIKPATLWESIKSWIIGYEIDDELNYIDFKNHIESVVVLDDMMEEQNLIRFKITTSSPNKYEQLLRDLIFSSDNKIKERELLKNKNKISFLSNKISSVTDVEIKSVLIGLLKDQLLNESLAGQDSLYSIEILEEPRRSKNPDFINLQFIYFGLSFIGFMLSILYLYIKKSVFAS